MLAVKPFRELDSHTSHYLQMEVRGVWHGCGRYRYKIYLSLSSTVKNVQYIWWHNVIMHLVNCKKIDTSVHLWMCIQKFPDGPPGAGTSNGTSFLHYVQLYRYFVSQSSQFCPIYVCVASEWVFYCCVYFVIDSIRKLLDTPSYIFVPPFSMFIYITVQASVNPLATSHHVTTCFRKVHLFLYRSHNSPVVCRWAPPSLLSNGLQGLFPWR